MLSTCIILRQLASLSRLKYLEAFFGKHAPQLSEIFWEGIEQLLEELQHLFTGKWIQRS